MLVGVFLLLSCTLWDRRIATSSRHNRQSALNSIYYIAANKPHPCNGFYEYSLRKLSACTQQCVPGSHFCRLGTRLECRQLTRPSPLNFTPPFCGKVWAGDYGHVYTTMFLAKNDDFSLRLHVLFTRKQ